MLHTSAEDNALRLMETQDLFVQREAVCVACHLVMSSASRVRTSVVHTASGGCRAAGWGEPGTPQEWMYELGDNVWEVYNKAVAVAGDSGVRKADSFARCHPGQGLLASSCCLEDVVHRMAGA